jgi:hypothetical protein
MQEKWQEFVKYTVRQQKNSGTSGKKKEVYRARHNFIQPKKVPSKQLKGSLQLLVETFAKLANDRLFEKPKNRNVVFFTKAARAPAYILTVVAERQIIAYPPDANGVEVARNWLAVGGFALQKSSFDGAQARSAFGEVGVGALFAAAYQRRNQLAVVVAHCHALSGYGFFAFWGEVGVEFWQFLQQYFFFALLQRSAAVAIHAAYAGASVQVAAKAAGKQVCGHYFIVYL